MSVYSIDFLIGSRRIKTRVTFRFCGIWSVYFHDFPICYWLPIYVGCMKAHDFQGSQITGHSLCKDLDN